MRYKKEASVLFAALLLATIPMVLAGYEENIREDIFLVRPENEFMVDTTIPTYLENEDLIFFACLESENVPIRLSVLCDDTNEFQDVPAHRWGQQNCFMGSMNLEDLDCSRATVQADYVSNGENLQLQQEIRINKFSNTLNRIVESQFADGGWETPLDTAYGLLVINHFPDIFAERIRRAIDYLKLNRDEESKCWPEDDCRISTTSNILYLLELAGFEDLRVQHDGLLYLERTQNYLSGEDWQVTITDHPFNINNTFNTSCVYDYQNSISSFGIPRNPAETTLDFSPAYNGYLNIVCTENVIVNLTNEYDEPLVNYQGDNFSYTIPQACWTLDNENINCDVRSTLYASNTDISTSQKSAARSYLSTLLVDDRTAGQHIEENWSVVNDALYLYSGASGSGNVQTALLFHQNNSGGWHMENDYYERTYFQLAQDEFNRLEAEVTDQVTKDIVATGYSIMAMIESGFERDDEPILDAERWVSLNEDQTSLNYTDEDLTDEESVESFQQNRSLILNDTKRNAMAFFVLQNNARPLLIADPAVLVMNEKTKELDIINPTIFDLEELDYEFAPSIDRYLSVEAKDFVGAYSFRRVTVNLDTAGPVDEIGYLRILQGDQEYLKVPIILESTPRLNITLPEQLTVFGASTVLPFRIDKSSHEFKCSMEWVSEGISSQSRFNINSANATYNFPVRFAVLETENAVYEGDITCVAREVTFKIPFATNIVRFSNTPMQVFPEVVSISDSTEEGWIIVENQLDESIDVSVELAIPDPYISLSETSLNLFPGESRNITVQTIPPEGENYTTSNSIIFRTFNVEERVLLEADILVQAESSLGIIWWSVIIFIALVLVGSGSYFGWRYREEIAAWYAQKFQKEDIKKKVLEQVEQIEREEELVAIRNMMRILKLQGLKDTEVRDRLSSEGFTDEDINQALAGPQNTEEEPEEETQ